MTSWQRKSAESVVHAILFLAFIFCFLGCCETTKDLNIHELRLVAQHLKHEDCRKLIAALHHKEFYLKVEEVKAENTNKSCLFLLLKWDRTEGRGKTFYDLPLRLRQLGHVVLAKKLSKIVYHEKALNLKRTLTDDPFKTMVDKDSFLLDNDKVQREVHVQTDEGSIDFITLFWAVCGAMSFFILLRISFRIFCPGAFARFWKKMSPQPVSDGCQFCCSEIDRITARLKKLYKRYVVGIHVENDLLDEEV